MERFLVAGGDGAHHRRQLGERPIKGGPVPAADVTGLNGVTCELREGGECIRVAGVGEMPTGSGWKRERAGCGATEEEWSGGGGVHFGLGCG